MKKVENVIIKAKISFIGFLFPVLFTLFLSMGLFASESAAEATEYVGVIIFFFVLTSIPALKERLTYYLILTDVQVEGKQGIFKTKVMSLPVKHIQNITIKQNFLGKIFKYATLEISTQGGLFSFKRVTNAELFKSKVFELINNN